MILIWILGVLLFALLEIGHPGLFLFLSFSFGSLFALTTDLFGFSFPIQIIVFFASSLIGFLLLKYNMYLILPKELKTNSSALVGKSVLFLKDLGNGVFEVKVEGQIWSAKFEKNNLNLSDLAVGICVVKDVKGCHLIIGRSN